MWLRILATRGQTVLGDFTTQGVRVQTVLGDFATQGVRCYVFGDEDITSEKAYPSDIREVSLHSCTTALSNIAVLSPL